MTAHDSRPLSYTETQMINDGVGAMFAITTVAGEVDTALLDEALVVLAEGQPQLRTRVDDGVLVSIGEPPPVRLCPSLAEEINTPLDRGKGVVRVSVVRGARTSVVLAIDHTVGDGRYTLAMNRELWRLYTLLSEDQEIVPIRRSGLAPATETRLAGAFPTAELEALAAGGPAPNTATLPVEPGEAAGIALDVLLLEEETTTSLLSVARAENVTVHALITGAIMVGLRPFLIGGDTITCGSPVDLRTRLGVEEDIASCCVGLSVAMVPATTDDGPVALAGMVRAQIDDWLDARMPEKLLLAGPMLPPDTGTGVTVGVSNLGRLVAPVLPAGLDLADLQIFTVGTAALPVFVVTTVLGRLRLTLVYNKAAHSAAQMAAVMASIDAALKSCAVPAFAV